MLRSLTIGILMILLATAVWADGLMIPVRPEVPRFSVSYHRVKTTIDKQVATTDIDQAFHNHANQQVEGTYIFPLADGISISKFDMYVGNEALPHRTLSKDEARSIYNGIVAKRKDPALLEWLGTGMIQASVFPIMPNEDKRIRIAYQEVLKAQGGIVKYVYPLKTEKVSSQPLKECSIDVTINSAQPIRSIYSPTHQITIERKGENVAHVTYSEKDVTPDQDFVLYYTVSEENLGMNLLAYRDPEKGDGYFLLLASPKAELRDDEVQPKDVVFVLDKSGSMANDGKIEQAKNALKYCLNSLDPRDRFTVMAFNEDVRWWQKSIQPATRENVKAAVEFVEQFKAEGGTNIDLALRSALEAMKPGDDAKRRPSAVIFLTDGQPTVGVTDTEAILDTVGKTNKRNARIFDFGVGSDYNAHFLDKLADQSNGYAENVLPKEDIEVKVSNFYAKVSSPILMNLALDWGNADVYDLLPKTLPDLFKGSQLLLVGRYKVKDANVKTTLTLTGEVNGKTQTIKYSLNLPTSDYTDEFIPRLWATRRIGYLEDQLRLNGTKDELMKELIRLSKEYGILSQYTSFLVDMDVNPPNTVGALGPAGPAENKPIFGQTEAGQARTGIAVVGGKRGQETGDSAVAQSVNSKAGYATTSPAPTAGNFVINDAGEKVQLSQLRNMSQRSFVQSGKQWVDVNFNAKQKLLKVKAFSPAYFQLANGNARMAQFLSMSDNVIVALKDTAIQVSDEGQAEEFKAAEYKQLKTEMDGVLGVQSSKASATPVAMLPVRGGRVSWGWALLLLPALPAMMMTRRMARKR